MNKLYKPRGYWTKDKCHEEALKYNTLTEFENNDIGAFSAAKRNRWLSEVCAHMNIRTKNQKVIGQKKDVKKKP